MAAGKFDLRDLERRMRGAVDALKKEFAGLRTGRASIHLLDPVMVNVYGAALREASDIDELEPEPIEEARKYLDHVSRQWDDALARLKAHVED